jgi:hypothetical protein
LKEGCQVKRKDWNSYLRLGNAEVPEILYKTLTKEQIDYLVKNGKMPEEDEETSLESMSITKLRELAKEKGIKNYSKMSKAELLEELDN